MRLIGWKIPPRRGSGGLSWCIGLLVLALALVLASCGSAATPHTTSAPRTSRAAIGAASAGQAQTPAFTYVAIGASDAYGIGTDDPDRLNWPTVLSTSLGSHVHLVNLGIPGATVEFAQKTELPVAFDAHPNVVTIWLAVNDIADNVPLPTYTSQLGAMLSALHTKTSAHIFVGNLPDLTLLPYFAGQNHDQLVTKVQAWNAAIAQVTAQNDATLVDLYSGWSELASHPEYLASDGLHPSTIGARRLAQIFATAITQAGIHP